MLTRETINRIINIKENPTEGFREIVLCQIEQAIYRDKFAKKLTINHPIANAKVHEEYIIPKLKEHGFEVSDVKKKEYQISYIIRW